MTQSCQASAGPPPAASRGGMGSREKANIGRHTSAFLGPMLACPNEWGCRPAKRPVAARGGAPARSWTRAGRALAPACPCRDEHQGGPTATTRLNVASSAVPGTEAAARVIGPHRNPLHVQALSIYGSRPRVPAERRQTT